MSTSKLVLKIKATFLRGRYFKRMKDTEFEFAFSFYCVLLRLATRTVSTISTSVDQLFSQPLTQSWCEFDYFYSYNEEKGDISALQPHIYSITSNIHTPLLNMKMTNAKMNRNLHLLQHHHRYFCYKTTRLNATLSSSYSSFHS